LAAQLSRVGGHPRIGHPAAAAWFPRGSTVPDLDTLDYSAICGVARVVGIVTKSRSK